MKRAHKKYFDVKVRENKEEMLRDTLDPRYSRKAHHSIIIGHPIKAKAD